MAMNFLLTTFLFLFQAVSNRTPNSANAAAAAEESCTFCLPWWQTALIIAVVVVIAIWAVKKLGWHWPGKGKGTGAGNVHTVEPPK